VLAAVLKIVKDSGLPYQLTPTSTCIEGTMTDVWEVIRRCHEAVRAECAHFVVCVRMEEDGGETGKLAANVASVEIEAGEDLATEPPPAAPSSRPRELSPTVDTYVVTGVHTNPS
jgi:uncharacterized protein YqgV (UPF0045/DUF77 family)